MDDAYLAGLFDGEGYVIGVLRSIRGTRSSVGVCLGINLTDRWVLEAVQTYLGVGGIYTSEARNARHKQLFVWRLGKALEVTSVIDRMMPHLLIKRERAELAKQLCALVLNKGRKTTYRLCLDPEDLRERLLIYDELRKLNHRGRP